MKQNRKELRELYRQHRLFLNFHEDKENHRNMEKFAQDNLITSLQI